MIIILNLDIVKLFTNILRVPAGHASQGALQTFPLPLSSTSVPFCAAALDRPLLQLPLPLCPSPEDHMDILQPFSPRYPPLVSASNSFRHSLQNQEPHRSGKQADALQISTLLPLLQIQSPESSQLCSRLSAVGAPLLAPISRRLG